MSSNRVLQVFLFAMMAVLVAAGLYTSAIFHERQSAMEKISRYNVAYTASQAVIEFERLQLALLRLQQTQTAAELADAKLRFEILYNRAEVFNQGDFRDFVHLDSRRLLVLAALRSAIQAIEPVMAAGGPGMSVAGPLAVLAPLEASVIALASEANKYGADLAVQDRRDLASLHQRFAVLTFGLIVCGLLLVGMITWHNRLLVRAHRTLSLTTADLKRAAGELASANRAVAAANGELREQNQRLSEKEEALRRQNRLFDAALNNMSQGLCMFDDDLRPMVFNTQFERLFEMNCQRSGKITAEACQPSLREMAPEVTAELEANISASQAATFEVECPDNRVIAVSQVPMSEGGWVATFEDVTEQRRAQARIEHMARHDGLTNLPNRYAFRERLQAALAEHDADGTMLAVMCLDLDQFKEVNDTLGHPTGDALLCAVAERLTGSVREGDMVARFGGDEFAILQPRIADPAEAEALAKRLIEAMGQPFAIGGELVYATGSLGIAHTPAHGDDPDALLKNADLALYAAKADGRRTYRFFEVEMDERLAHRHAMERDLRLALAAGELRLHYQPVVHLRTGRITGLEALLRWNHPVRGMVPPVEFIPIAEEAGLIVDIGRWVLRRACADATEWPHPLTVSVNLSVAQFSQGDVVGDVEAALAKSGLHASRLVVEITESLLLSESRQTLDALTRLKALGIAIAMDDFGTGYSSLSYLRKYPFDRIKIDRAFLATSSEGEQGKAIIQTIINLGTSLGMTTVAEGVETERDLEMLLAAGCPEGQGYLFSPAVPREEVLKLLARQSSFMRVA